jgi:tRNA G18 (ribose-2'-O)-methylase SpoU
MMHDITQFIYGPLMLILQKAYLFYRTEDGETFSDNCPRIGKYLSEYLNSFVTWLPNIESKHQFLEQLTNIICGYTWNSISLLFICKSLRDLNLDSFNLNVVCVRNLCQILKCSLTTHEPFIRSAIQTILLQALLKHSKISNSDEFQHFFDSINIISVKECIQYRNTSWFELVNWFNNENNNKFKYLKYLDTEFNQFIELETNTDEFSIQNRSIKLAKLMLILTDLTNTNVKQIDLILDKLTNCNRNLYMSSERIGKCLFIFNFMISFANNNKTVEYLYDNCACHILDYLLRCLNEANLTFKKINIYTDLFDNIIQFKDSVLIRDKLIKQYLPVIELNLQEVNNLNNFNIEWKRFIFLNIYTSLIKSNISKTKPFIDFAVKNQNKLLSLKPLNKSFINKLNKDVSDLIINDLMDQYSIFNGQYLEIIWQSNEFLLKHNSNIDLITAYEQSLELASPHCLASLVKFSKSLNPSQYVSNLVDLFNLIYQLIWDIREDVKNFNDSFQAFLDCLINKEILKANNSYLTNTILNLIDKSSEKACIIRLLTDKTLELLSSLNSEQNQLFIDILIRFLIFGDIFKKEKKHMKEIEIYIESFGESFGTNQLLKADYLNDSSVRISTLNYILNSTHLNSIFYSSFIEKLIYKDKSLADSNQKLFINSLVHRERFRLWQVILVILPKLNKKDYSVIMECAEQHLISENQPSMRIIIEWVIIKILTYQIETFDLFSLFIKLENFSHKKIGYMCSWLAVLTHLIFIINDYNLKSNYFISLIPLILSQILSSNFHVRTYVEAILIKIFTNLNDSKRNEEFLRNEKVKIILDQIYSIIHTIIDDKERHSSIILKHFYFQFDPIDDYSLDTIFNIFPYKSGIIEDELVTADQFLSIVLNKSIFNLKQTDYELNWLIKLKNKNENLNQCTSGIWRFIAYRDDVKNGENLSIEDLQKKIIPWQNLIPNHEDLKETRSNGNLVLVASLIDKQTNLGGICRTCEIFNVKELVVSSLKHLEDKEFQSLAVTAHKWLNIKEVTVKYLKKFLFEMKLQGYTLIGLEQTAKSVQLNKFEFPIKTLILLGNEKEGIPVDLIQMLEYCVEIPQLGVIRSLNVHVSCAICVWEYSKQNLIKN